MVHSSFKLDSHSSDVPDVITLLSEVFRPLMLALP
jgi:hypothetical protein